MQVVTEKLELPPLTLQNPDGKRLMTVDIGTTTIAMQLYDMTGKVVDSFPSVNPQVLGHDAKRKTGDHHKEIPILQGLLWPLQISDIVGGSRQCQRNHPPIITIG